MDLDDDNLEEELLPSRAPTTPSRMTSLPPPSTTTTTNRNRSVTPGQQQQRPASASRGGSKTPRKAAPTPARLRHDDSQIEFAPIIAATPELHAEESQHLTERQMEVRDRQRENAVLFPEIRSSPPVQQAQQPVEVVEVGEREVEEEEEQVVTPEEQLLPVPATAAATTTAEEDYVSTTPTPRRLAMPAAAAPPAKDTDMADDAPSSPPEVALPPPRGNPLEAEIKSRSAARAKQSSLLGMMEDSDWQVLSSSPVQGGSPTKLPPRVVGQQSLAGVVLRGVMEEEEEEEDQDEQEDEQEAEEEDDDDDDLSSLPELDPEMEANDEVARKHSLLGAVERMEQVEEEGEEEQGQEEEEPELPEMEPQRQEDPEPEQEEEEEQEEEQEPEPEADADAQPSQQQDEDVDMPDTLPSEESVDEIGDSAALNESELVEESQPDEAIVVARSASPMKPPPPANDVATPCRSIRHADMILPSCERDDDPSDSDAFVDAVQTQQPTALSASNPQQRSLSPTKRSSSRLLARRSLTAQQQSPRPASSSSSFNPSGAPIEEDPSLLRLVVELEPATRNINPGEYARPVVTPTPSVSPGKKRRVRRRRRRIGELEDEDDYDDEEPHVNERIVVLARPLVTRDPLVTRNLRAQREARQARLLQQQQQQEASAEQDDENDEPESQSQTRTEKRKRGRPRKSSIPPATAEPTTKVEEEEEDEATVSQSQQTRSLRCGRKRAGSEALFTELPPRTRSSKRRRQTSTPRDEDEDDGDAEMHDDGEVPDSQAHATLDGGEAAAAADEQGQETLDSLVVATSREEEDIRLPREQREEQLHEEEEEEQGEEEKTLGEKLATGLRSFLGELRGDGAAVSRGECEVIEDVLWDLKKALLEAESRGRASKGKKGRGGR